MASAIEIAEAAERQDVRRRWLLTMPSLIIILFAAVGPLFVMLAYSFFEKADYGGVKYGEFTTEAWFSVFFQRDIFDDTVTWADAHLTILWRSVMLSLATTVVALIIGFPTAYFISTRPERTRDIWLFLITIPFWTSYLIRVFLWKVILGYNGVINSGLLSLGIIDEPLTVINYSVGSMVATLAHAYAPFAILPIFVSLEKIDRSFLEAGQDLGESKLMTFWRVTLPLSMPGVIAAVLIVFIPTIGDYVTPDLIGGGKIPMIANMIEGKMLKQNDKAVGAAIAVTAMLIVSVVSIVFLLLNKRFLRGQK